MNAIHRPSRPCVGALLVLIVFVVSACTRSELANEPTSESPRPVLRVSADPNNLPFTNDKLEGFENKIAELVADDLGMQLEYHWRAQRRGFFRHALTENECDVVLGVPAGFERALTTSPYYTSSYVFVYREDRGLKIASLDDPTLRNLKIGVQMIGDDGTNTPPAHALAARGMIANVVGFTLYGDYQEPNPPARIIDAVVRGEIDVAIAWGPMAGHFAKAQRTTPLEVVPVSPATDPSGLPFVFSIAMGCRKQDRALRDELEHVLTRRRPEIEKILDDYGVPRVPSVGSAAGIYDDD